MALTLRKGPARAVPFLFGHDVAAGVQIPIYSILEGVSNVGPLPAGEQCAFATDAEGVQVPLVAIRSGSSSLEKPSRLGVPFATAEDASGNIAPMVVLIQSGLTVRKGAIIGQPFPVEYESGDGLQFAAFGLYAGTLDYKTSPVLGVPFAHGVDGEGVQYPLIAFHPDGPQPGGGGDPTPALVLTGTAAALTDGDAETIQSDYLGFSAVDQVPPFGTGDSTLPWALYYLHRFGANMGDGHVYASQALVDGDQGTPYTFCKVKVAGVEFGPYQMELLPDSTRYSALHAGIDLRPTVGQALELSLFTSPFPEDGALSWTCEAGTVSYGVGYLSDNATGSGPGSQVGSVLSGPAKKLDWCYTYDNGTDMTLAVGIRTTLANPSTTLEVSVNGGAPIAVPFTLSEGLLSGEVASVPALVEGDTISVVLS